eukprot:SM000096S24889  [mRNA]  locus=s96:322373:324062:- [translate_table: standard]
MPAKRGAKPAEAYGFVCSIAIVVAYVLYILWAYLPEAYLHAAGVTYYPSRYWAIAIPAYVPVALLFVFMVYASLNHLSTHPPDSPYCIYDEYTRAPAKKLDSATRVRHSIPPISDMPLTDVNDLLYGPESEYMQALMQMIQQPTDTSKAAQTSTRVADHTAVTCIAVSGRATACWWPSRTIQAYQCVCQVTKSIGSREQGFAVVVRHVPAQATGGRVLAVEAAAGPSPLPVSATGVGAVFGGVPPVDDDATVLAPLAIDALVRWRQSIQAPVT